MLRLRLWIGGHQGHLAGGEKHVGRLLLLRLELEHGRMLGLLLLANDSSAGHVERRCSYILLLTSRDLKVRRRLVMLEHRRRRRLPSEGVGLVGTAAAGRGGASVAGGLRVGHRHG